MNRNFKALSTFLALSCAPVGSALAQDASQLLLPPASHTRPVPSPADSAASPSSSAPGVSASDEAFEEALKGIVPLTPDQIREMRRHLDAADEATGMPLQAVQPVTRSIGISMKSGERPAAIKVSPGWISTLTFSDVTGQPWPVASITNGNPDAYHIQSSGPENSSNIITISARQSFVPSNIAITLAGARVPILMTLDPSASAVDFRVDAQLDERGPNAAYDMIGGSSLPATGDSLMLSFLDGVPPEGARARRTSHGNVQAWLYDEMLYVRTSRVLLAPAFISKQSNASGVNVYVLKEDPVLMFSDQGRTEFVQIMR